ncbi:MAG TPA: hypothetical protein VK395_03075 [Gemmataceae bacterium]|nr:hypothetical protein [Gemmataceae bacterium]
MKQQVDIRLKLSLWLDAAMDQDDIVTYVRAALPEAFGEDLTAMANPVDILDIREEAAIYSPINTSGSTPGPWAVYRLADDAETYGSNAGKLIVTTADNEVEITGIINREADAFLIAASPRLLASLLECARLLADYDESDGEEGVAYREAIAAIAKAIRNAA